MKPQSRFSLHQKFFLRKSPQSRYISDNKLIPLYLYVFTNQLRVVFIGCLLPCLFGVHLIFARRKLHRQLVLVPFLTFVPDPAHRSPVQLVPGLPREYERLPLLQMHTFFSLAHLQMCKNARYLYIETSAILG